MNLLHYVRAAIISLFAGALVGLVSADILNNPAIAIQVGVVAGFVICGVFLVTTEAEDDNDYYDDGYIG